MKFFKETELFKKENNIVRCLACRRRCGISEGRKGFCGVRINESGRLLVPYGYFSSFNIDPIEKKPVYHFLPGSYTVSFGMFGCNFRCLYCQNWEISQVEEFRNISDISRYVIKSTPKEVFDILNGKGIKIIVSTYNEPAVSIEWAYDIFSYAKKMDKSIKTGFVTNGYLSEEAVEYILPYIDFIRIDMKVFEEEKFRKLTSAEFDKYISSVKYIASKNIHIEFVNLVVEGFNDDIEEFNNMIDFIVSISCDIPLHLTAFHPDYKMTDRKRTSGDKINRMIEHAKKRGLRYVYGGNYMTPYSDTLCPKCGRVLVKRGYMETLDVDMDVEDKIGRCPSCRTFIYGVWGF